MITGLIKKDFSEDGIIDPTIWFSDAEQAKPKILFVLKETNQLKKTVQALWRGV